MNKTILSACLFLAFGLSAATAEEVNNTYRSILIDETAESQMSATKQEINDAQNQAKEMLNKRPRIIRKQKFPNLKTSKVQLPTPPSQTAQAAPFGLIWGSSIEETQSQGILLQKINEKDYVNSFSATHLPKTVKDFSRIDVTYGEENELWRIIAYGKKLEDTPEAKNILRQYKIYKDLLTKKYGNAQEFFTPATINIEEKDDKGRAITVKKEAPIGNPDFLKQLQNGTAVLYSTYNNNDIGAALAINVDGEGKSYIVLDYKNLKILRQRENQTLDAL